MNWIPFIIFFIWFFVRAIMVSIYKRKYNDAIDMKSRRMLDEAVYEWEKAKIYLFVAFLIAQVLGLVLWFIIN